MIFVSHGDKGGTGKSMLSALLVDYLLSQGREVAILEGDLGQPDIARRFAGKVRVGAVNLNQAGAADAAVAAFGGWLEEQKSGDAVVNLPAGAGDTLDALADVLVAVAEGIGQRVGVVYSLGAYETSTQGALRSFEHGLLGAAHRRVAALPEFLGAPAAFHWQRAGAGAVFLRTGGIEVAIPALRPESLRDKVLSLPGSFTDLVTSPELTLTERAMFQRWLSKGHAAAAVITGEPQ